MTNAPREYRLSQRMRGLGPSAVREILKVAERPEVISFAGGLPAPELFPVAAIAEAYQHVLASSGPRALQYGVTEGYGPLREWIAARLGRRQVKSSVEQLLVTSGSQQGIDLVARALLDPGEVVVTENPTYLAALQAFAACQAEPVAVGSDEDGMRVDELEALLARRRARLIYLCPDFQNPKGTTLSVERRLHLVEIARRHGVLILEDDPYGELRFRGAAPPALAALDDERVVRLGTFSKTLAPGLRIGWIHGPAPLVRRLAILKQASDLHTATLAQWAAARILASFDFDAHVARIAAVYGRRRDAMLQALEAGMPAGARFTRPDGGLFLWLALPPPLRDDDVFRAALERGVAVVPGSGFFVGGADHGFLRLNYSNQQVDSIERGVGLLGEAIAALRTAGSERGRAPIAPTA